MTRQMIGSNSKAPVTDASGYEKRHGIVPRRKPVPSSAIDTTTDQPRMSIRSSSPSASSMVGRRTSNGNSNSNKPLPPLPEPLSRASLLSTLDTFHRSLSHTRYAVSGMAALAVWGYTARDPNRVTVMCCSSDKAIIRTWAKVAGWHLYPSQPDIIGLPTSQKGVIRRVRLKGLESDETFDRQERIIPAKLASCEGILPTQAKVLTPVALLNQFAHTYMVEMQRAQDHTGEQTERTRVEHAQRAAEIASMIIWILERMNSTLQVLSRTGHLSGTSKVFIPPSGLQEITARLSYAINAKFRETFDQNHPGAVHLWTRCGLNVEDLHISSFAPAPLGGRQSGSGSTSSSLTTVSRSNTGKSSSAATTTTSSDGASLAEWQIPDDLQAMMDEAAAEYNEEDRWC
ncbi:hypothetical protein V8F20_010793 [Naviculisporaceae sp. PSN 640]